MSGEIEIHPSLVVSNCFMHRRKLSDALNTNADIIKAALIGETLQIKSGSYQGRMALIENVSTFCDNYSVAPFRADCKIRKLRGDGFLAKNQIIYLKEFGLDYPDVGVAL